MRYLSVAEAAKKWNMSERSVRNYCAQGRVLGVFLTGETWNIPTGNRCVPLNVLWILYRKRNTFVVRAERDMVSGKYYSDKKEKFFEYKFR